MTAPRYEWLEGIQMAAQIMQRHPDVLIGVPPLSDILFVMDTEAAPTSKGNDVMARVSKIAGKVVDFIDAGNKLWMLEWFAVNTSHMTINQKRVVMAHELLHFIFDAEHGVNRLRGHDVEEFSLILDRFGSQWTSPNRGDVDDILAPGFRWGAVGQSTLRFDQDTVQQIADGVAGAVPGTQVTVSTGGHQATGKVLPMRPTGTERGA
jgi:hypothetical protein